MVARRVRDRAIHAPPEHVRRGRHGGHADDRLQAVEQAAPQQLPGGQHPLEIAIGIHGHDGRGTLRPCHALLVERSRHEHGAVRRDRDAVGHVGRPADRDVREHRARIPQGRVAEPLEGQQVARAPAVVGGRLEADDRALGQLTVGPRDGHAHGHQRPSIRRQVEIEVEGPRLTIDLGQPEVVGVLRAGRAGAQPVADDEAGRGGHRH